MASKAYTPSPGSQVPNDQAVHGLAVNISSTDQALSPPSRWIWVGSAGNLEVQLVGDTTPVTFTSVPAGSLLPISASAVVKASTTASNIVALW